MTSPASIPGNNPSTSVPSFFSERNGHVFDLKTGKEYKIQIEDVLGVKDEDAGELTQTCLHVLQTVEKSSDSIIQLQDLSISWGGVDTGPKGKKIAYGSQLSQQSHIKDTFDNKLSALRDEAKLETNNRKIVLKEVEGPWQNFVQTLIKDINPVDGPASFIKKLIHQIQSKEEKAENDRAKGRSFVTRIFAETAKIYNIVSRETNELAELKKLQSHLEKLYDNAQSDILGTGDGHNETIQSDAAEIHHAQILTLLHLVRYFKKYLDPEQNKQVLENLSEVLKMYSEFTTNPILNDSLLKEEAFRTLIHEHAEKHIDVLIEIEEIYPHSLELKNLHKNENNPVIKAKIGHELAHTQLYLLSAQRKLLIQLRSSLIDSIPKDRPFSDSEAEKIQTLDLRYSELTKESEKVNGERKKLEQAYIEISKESGLSYTRAIENLKTSIVPSSLGKKILATTPHSLRATEDVIESKEIKADKSRAQNIYEAFSTAIATIQGLRDTLAVLKSIKQKLNSDIDERKQIIEKINEEVEPTPIEKDARIQPIQNEIKILENEKRQIDLQRQHAVMTKLRDEIETLHYRINKTTRDVKMKNAIIAEEQARQSLYLVLLDPKADQSDEATKALVGERILKDVYINLPPKGNNEEQNKIRENAIRTRLKSSQEKVNKLNFELDLSQAEINQTEERIELLNSRYNKIMAVYKDKWSAPLVAFIPQLTDWVKEALTTAATFGIISHTHPPHPQELKVKKQYADIGYNFCEAMEDWAEEIRSKKVPASTYWGDLIKEFHEWAYLHPATASELAGDIALTLSIVGQKSLCESFLAGLKGKVFTYAILKEIGTHNAPKIEDKKAMKFRALADLCRHTPMIATATKSVTKMVTATLAAAASGAGPLGAVGALCYAYTEGAVDTAGTKAVRDAIDNVSGAQGESFLKKARLIHNTFLTGVYIDSAVEQESLAMAKQVTLAYHSLTHHKHLGIYLANKVIDWWKTIKVSSSFAETFLRATPAIAASSIVGLSVLVLTVGAPFTWALVGALAAVALPFFFWGFPSQLEPLLNSAFPSTQIRIKMARENEIIAKETPKLNQIAKDYKNSLFKNQTLPSVKPLEINKEDLSTYNNWKNNEASKSKIKQIEQEYLTSLAKKTKEYEDKLADDFRKRWTGLRDQKAALGEKFLDDVYIDQQRLIDFTDSKNSKIHEFRTPIMTQVVELYTDTVNIKKLRKEVRNQLDLPNDPTLKDQPNLQDLIVENCVRDITSRLINGWLEPQLQTAAKEQFRAFFVTYKDEFASDEAITKEFNAIQKERDEKIEEGFVDLGTTKAESVDLFTEANKLMVRRREAHNPKSVSRAK